MDTQNRLPRQRRPTKYRVIVPTLANAAWFQKALPLAWQSLH